MSSKTENEKWISYGKKVSEMSRELYLGEFIMELNTAPSALEFLRLVALNKPFIIRGYDKSLVNQWTNEYLRNKMTNQQVNVSCTPDGWADAVREIVDEDGELIKRFMLPFEDTMDFGQVMEAIINENLTPHVNYVQTQNDCLRGSAYQKLFEDILPDIPWATVALGSGPDAINFWMGNSRSTTSLHRDNYENLYLVVRGTKKFTIYPPTDYFMFPTQEYPVYRYDSCMKSISQDYKCPWYPLEPTDKTVKPFVASIGPGDLFYLPALYYHKVEQYSDENGLVVAINYWYDMAFDQKYCWTHAFD